MNRGLGAANAAPLIEHEARDRVLQQVQIAIGVHRRDPDSDVGARL